MAIPTPEEVIGEAAAVLMAICESLEDATRWTRDFSHRYSEDTPDPNLAPNLMRYFAVRYLDNAGHVLLTTEYEREQISNNGIMVTSGRYQIRVRKAVDGFELPPPASQVLHSFYEQGQLLLPLPPTSSDPADIRLMLLWDVDRDYGITSFTLVLPRAGGNKPTAYWSVPLSAEILRQLEENNDIEMNVREDNKKRKSDPESD